MYFCKLNIWHLTTISKNTIEEIDEIFSKKRNIVITFHYNPDGDAVGSGLALYLLLKKFKHNISIISPNNIPEFLKWMPGSNDIIIYKEQQQTVAEKFQQADIIICLDFNKIDRLKEMSKTIEESNAKIILIDHHINPETFPDIIISETNISSTAELLYQTLKQLKYTQYFDKEIASCLFAGIMTDTGAFNYGFKKSLTFTVAAELMKYNIDKDDIYDKIYNNFSEDRMRLMGYCLTNKMVVLKEFKTAYISLTQDEFKKYNYQAGDTEGFVNLPFSIKGVNFSVLFTEQYDHIKISLRSKGDFDTNKFAKKHFNGGGHKNASGGQQYNMTITETIDKFKKILPEYAKTLSK